MKSRRSFPCYVINSYQHPGVRRLLADNRSTNKKQLHKHDDMTWRHTDSLTDTDEINNVSNRALTGDWLQLPLAHVSQSPAVVGGKTPLQQTGLYA